MKKLALFLLLLTALATGCSQGSSIFRSDTPTLAPLANVPGSEPPTREAPGTPTPEGEEAAITRITPEDDGTPEASRPASTEDASDPSPAPTEQEATAPTPTVTRSPFADVRGALIQVTMESRVGVLLDEFPASMRERVADEILQQPEEAWMARARRQIQLSRLRLNYRDSVRPGRGQLPLTQPEQWSISLDPAGPSRQTIQTHDLILVGYTLTTTLLTDANSVVAAEPTLAEIGGDWEEPFLFPADPDFLLQRTGRSCIDDDGFPPNSVDSENAWHFYDFAVSSCHEVLAFRIGVVETTMHFERLPWDAALADQVRSGPVTSEEGPDLAVVSEDLDNNRIVYRYFEEGDCALEEGAVGAEGWRRLLTFEATVHNAGNEALHIGPVRDATDDDAFEYAPCHEHVHYRYYGDFTLQNQGQLTTSKQAFCVQSTDRLSNNELSPLTHDYSCRTQGIQTGWVDEYVAGLDTQWVDITDLEIPAEGETYQLGFVANPNRFLCEGTPVLDEEGDPLLEPSELTTEDGDPVNRPQCEFISEWEENNEAERDVFLPATGSFVTAPCRDGEIGPRRNCDFREVTVEGVDAACRAGQPVTLSLLAAEEDAPQVVRVCERSAALGTGIACTYGDSLANVVVEGNATNVTFTCPILRDAEEGDGDDTGG
ncbi:MAG: lysyl oxidase family protein, partial [Candidatus Promineifilaceae bacterium]|nr:lysyl oxidase family protein [Candidatus Promineifilaceae bacterium]